MQKTANQIKSSFELLASGHYQIHSFLYAQEFEQQAYENLIYPLMLVYPLGGSLSATTYSRNYRVIIADRVLKSEGNELEVESDTQLIALDVLAYWMKLGQNERFTITSSNTITPFWEKWGDDVTGHFVDIGIEEFYDFNSCAIPLSGSIPTPPNPCKDARISVNSVVYGNAPSDSNFNVVVKDQLGSLVGSLIGGEWIVNTGGSCADATYTIEDTLGNVLYTGTIPSGGNLDRTINNSTLNVNKSDGSLISSRSILAEGTDGYDVADSLIENDATTPTYSQLVKATEGLILPTQEIQNNGVASGFIPSVGTINVTTNVVPTSFNISGRTIDIVVPSGGGSYDLDLVDRFGNAFPTASVSANATWDLRTLTPFDFADIFLNQLTAPSSTIQTAIIDLVDDLNAAGLWDEFYTIHPLVNGNANDHALNLKYPFRKISANLAYFIGSPLHNANGITTNGSNAMVIPISPDVYANGGDRFGMSIYSRTDGAAASNLANDMGGCLGLNNEQVRIFIRSANNNQLASMGGGGDIYYTPTYTGSALGLFSTIIGSSVDSLTRNGVILGGTLKSPSAQPKIYAVSIGGFFNNQTLGIVWGIARNYAYASTQKAWGITQEADHYTAVQAFQTALSRNV